MIDVFVYMMDLPTSTDGFTRYNAEDDTYTIVLNSRSAYSRRVRAYDHEVRHIMRGDFQRHDVQAIEYDCHERKEK